MKPVITSFGAYIEKHENTPTQKDIARYRRLGRLDVLHGDSEVRAAAEAALVLLETWFLMKLEQPDLGLGQMCAAGRHLAGYDKSTTDAALRLSAMLSTSYPMSVAGAEALYAGMKGEDAASFRRAPLWIGGASPEDARYVAPEATKLPDYMHELCEALEKPTETPMHLLGTAHSYAFLLLPFAKDNARWVGVWTQSMARELHLPQQSLMPFACGVLEYKEMYSRDLLGCALGETEAWQATWDQIVDKALQAAEQTTEGIWQLWQQVMATTKTFGKTHIHLPAFLQFLAGNPYVTLQDICEATGLTKPNASLFLQRCLKIKLLRQVTFDHRNRVYMAPAVIRLLSAC